MRSADKSPTQNPTYKDEWLTPPYILEALGPFDLDPCAPINRPWDMAKNHFTVEDHGLMQHWDGRVWLNPPYGEETWKWMIHLALHQNGIALIFARTETQGFHQCVWNAAQAVLFLKGRIIFYHLDGAKASSNAAAPSVLVAYGEENAEALKTSGLPGKFIRLEAG